MTAPITIVTRTGRQEPVDIGKIRRVVHWALQDLPNCDPLELELDAQIHFQDGMTTREIQQTLIRVANEKTTEQAPYWALAAGRLLLHELYQDASLQRSDADPDRGRPYGDFATLVTHLTAIGRYDPAIAASYGPEGLRALGQLIQPGRDRLLDYGGLKHLSDRYAIRDADDGVYELPQEVFLGVAAALALADPPAERLAWAHRYYDSLSTLRVTMATPTLAHARRPAGQLSSCFIDMPEDSILGIFRTLESFALVSQNGGGMGVYLGKLRALGSSIRGYAGVGGGVIPWVRLLNDTAVSVNQLGQRAGAVSVWLDVWHKDIVDFLDLKTANGDDRRKARDVFHGICIPDAFYRAVEADAPWYLFDPHEVEQVLGFRLEDTWGTEWDQRYQACIDTPALSRMEIPALDLMSLILKSVYETGGPFIFHRDTANRMNPNRHAGMIYASNLCTEIIQNMAPVAQSPAQMAENQLIVRSQPGTFVVCNLASLDLGKLHDDGDRDLSELVPVVVRMLDNVITLNHLPVPQATATNQAYRAIGLGVHGYHAYLAARQIPWESPAHVQAADHLFERIAYHAIQASMELARERSAYPLFPGSAWATGAAFRDRGYTGPEWDALADQVQQVGLRNGYLLAIAPTGSTSIIAGTTAGIDPIFAPVYTEEKKGFLLRQVAPGYGPETAPYYVAAHQVDQQWSIQAAAARQRHLDQSQSFNLYATADLDEARLLEWYLSAWRLGLKTVYYFRSYDFVAGDAECVACQV